MIKRIKTYVGERLLLLILREEREDDRHLQLLRLVLLGDALVEELHEVPVAVLVHIHGGRHSLRDKGGFLARPLAGGLAVLLAPLPLAGGLLPDGSIVSVIISVITVAVLLAPLAS